MTYNGVIGSFYFKLTNSGNLIGEYSNNNIFVVETECAKSRIGNNGFLGKFKSVWTDGTNKSDVYDLEIILKPGSTLVYGLRWEKKGAIYEGEGFIVDNMLIGCYKGV
mgnify:FL=1